MNHFTINAFCLIIGFMLGVGSIFSSTQLIVTFQGKRVAALTDTYRQLESLNRSQERFYLEKLANCTLKKKRR